MSTPTERIAARDSSWMLPCPDLRADLGFSQEYNADEFERIKKGLLPEAMEDKWYIFFEEPWLYFHRSWTGACIYGVRFAPQNGAASAVEAWASRDSTLYTETNIDYDRALLKFLIDALLLGKAVDFPLPKHFPKSSKSLYQHHVAGSAQRASSNWNRYISASVFDSLWNRIKSCFKR